MGKYALLTAIGLLLLASSGAGAAPVVTNVTASQDTTSLVVTIHYDLAEPESGDWPYVDIDISLNGGTSWVFSTDPTINSLPSGTKMPSVSRDVRTNVELGTSRTIIWDSIMDVANVHITDCKVRIHASTCKGYAGPMVTIPESTFNMGTSVGYCYLSSWGPSHSVHLTGYQIGKYEVSRGEYKKFIDDSGYTWHDDTYPCGYWSTDGWTWKNVVSRTQPDYWATSQNWGGGGFVQTMRHPVVGVTCYEAEAYCNWLNVRFRQAGTTQWHLPTEAEWELAARGPVDGRLYPWGYDHTTLKCWGQWNSGSHTALVNDFLGPEPNGDVSYPPYNVCNMAGNVSEWCKDWYVDGYPSSYQLCPQGASLSAGIGRSTRGGNWTNPWGTDGCNFTTFGRWYVPKDGGTGWTTGCNNSLGFRIARGGCTQ